jgi:hypothetical protein
MNKTLTLHVPFNAVSFGQISTALAREAFRQKIDTNIFPIGGNVDLSVYKIDQQFGSWLQNSINNSQKKHSRNNISTKLWHINSSLESVSKEQNLITFLETSECTDNEINILKNQRNVFVTSNYTKRIIEDYGLKNIKYLELGFDHDNFFDKKKSYYGEDIIVHGLFGKWEPCRKAHGKILRAWASKYGNNPKFRLHAALFNPFLKPEDQMNMINHELQGKRYHNIIFLPFLKTNEEFNDTINSIDIIISLSRGEGRDLPTYHAVGLGKYCVGLRAHAYLDYLNDDNSILINPNGRIKAEDGMFFHGDNSPFNRGSFYDWSDADMIESLEIANKKFISNKINKNGLKLQENTYKNTLNYLLKEI